MLSHILLTLNKLSHRISKFTYHYEILAVLTLLIIIFSHINYSKLNSQYSFYMFSLYFSSFWIFAACSHTLLLLCFFCSDSLSIYSIFRIFMDYLGLLTEVGSIVCILFIIVNITIVFQISLPSLIIAIVLSQINLNQLLAFCKSFIININNINWITIILIIL